MGVDLLIFSNHKIRGKGFEKRLTEIEARLNIEIEDISLSRSRDERSFSKTLVKDKIRFFTDLKRSKEFYEACGEIALHSNYQYLSMLRIFEKTMEFCPDTISTDMYWWKTYLGDEYEKEKKTDKYLEYNQGWKAFQEIQFDIAKKLGGDKFIYFADSSFQEEQELIYSKGKSLNKVIREIRKVGSIFHIDRLYNDYESLYDFKRPFRQYGLYEDMNAKSIGRIRQTLMKIRTWFKLSL